MNFKKALKSANVRLYINQALCDPSHPMYAASDVRIAKELHITRLTVINIRKEQKIESRKSRILKLLNGLDTGSLTINEIASRFHLKYQNIYQLIRKHGLKTRPDKKPIESLIESRKNHKHTNSQLIRTAS